jgi:hypothetical protein
MTFRESAVADLDGVDGGIDAVQRVGTAGRRAGDLRDAEQLVGGLDQQTALGSDLPRTRGCSWGSRRRGRVFGGHFA